MTGRKMFEMKLPNGKDAYLFGKDSGDPELHIDGVWGFMYIGAGTCKINLYTVAPEQDDPFERREVVARITMAAPTFFALKEFMNEQCKMLEDRGLVTVNPAENKPKDKAPKKARKPKK